MKKNFKYEFSDGKIIRKEAEEKEKTLFDLVEEEDPADNTEAFENAKENFDSRKSRERLKRILTVSILSLFLVVSALIFCFPLKNITVNWDAEYDVDAVQELVKDSAGQNALFVNGQAVKEALQSKYPQISGVEIEKKLPFGIEVEVVAENPEYYITLDGEYYLLSSELRVLSRSANESDTAGLLTLDVTEVKSAIAGEYLEFYADFQYDYVKKLLCDISSHTLYANIKSVDITNKFDIKLNYDERITVILGVGENVHTKLTLAQAYIDSLPSDDKGIIDSSSTDKGSYISLMK